MAATTRLIQADPERLRYLRELQQRAAQVKTGAAKYYDDPLGFAADCIDWRGDGLTAYQQGIIGDLPARKRMAVRGPHGLGKSTISAITVLWFALTRDAAGVDWKVATTAGSWHQLSKYLWPEIHKWTQRIRWDQVWDGRSLTPSEQVNLRLRGQPFSPSQLMNLNLRLTYGAAFAGASANAALIEGAHADSLLFVFDESKAIPAATFDACEGALNGPGEALALSLSTPGSPSGRFYDICSRRPGYEDWHPVHVTLDDAIAAGRISPEWAAQRRAQWGETSAIYQNRVLGEFHASDEDSVIPLSWAEAAVACWHEWDAAGRPDTGLPRTLGIDVARTGQDRTVLAVRNGPVLTELHRSVKEDTMQTTGRAVAILETGDWPRTAVVDVIGIGAGVVDRLRELEYPVVAFNASAGSKLKDASNSMGMLNSRSAAWWNMREMLDPSTDPDICLPDDDLLLGDLSAPQWRVQSGGKIQVESKEDIHKRIGRSTDDGDAAVQAFFVHSTPHQANARNWSAAGDLQRLGPRPDRRTGTQPDGDSWARESFAPRSDREAARHRPNVRSWG